MQNSKKLWNGQKETCKSGFDKNPQEVQKSTGEKRKSSLEFVVKMDVYHQRTDERQCENLDPESSLRKLLGHNASGSWFPGTETVDRLLSKR